MNLEHEFISKIIETESMRAMIEKRINPDFLKGRFRPIYQFMYNYYKDYRKTPSLDVIKREFPDFDTDIPQEPLDYYVDELRDRKTYEIMINGIEGLADLIEQREIEEAKDTLYKLQSKIATEVTVSRDINYADDIEARIERYLHKKENMGVDGIPIGIDAIDNTTSGAHKGELITIAARPGTGKCVAWDSEVIVPSTGEKITIEEFIERGEEEVYAWNQETGKLEVAKVKKHIDSGVKPVYDVGLQDGREVEVTGSHPFLTVDGWKNVKEIDEGQYVGVPKKIGCFGNVKPREEYVKALGYLVAEGGLTKGHITFTNEDDEIVEDFRSVCNYYGTSIKPYKNDEITYSVCGFGRGRNSKNKLRDLTDKWGLTYKKSVDKKLPEEVFEYDKESTCLLLGILWSCDGYVSREGSQSTISFGTGSQELTEQVMHLLHKLGFKPKYRKKPEIPAYEITITHARELQRFVNLISFVGEKKERVKDWSGLNVGRKLGRVPLSEELIDKIDNRRQELNLSWADLKRQLGLSKFCRSRLERNSTIGKDVLKRLGNLLDFPAITQLAEAEITWIKVNKIKENGEKQVYDLSVEYPYNNFIANDILVHNTWFEVAVVAKHALENNYRLLFITKEMEPEQIALRMDAPLLGYDYDNLRMGALGNKSEREYFEKLHEIAAEYNDFVISGDDGEGTVTDVQAKIDEHKPDLVIVDGSYLLRDEEGGRSFHEKAMNITRGLKRVARNTEIPLYNSTQANRKTGRKRAPEMEDIAFSDAYAQDSDVLISLYRTKEMKISNKLGVKLAKVREGDDTGHYLLNWDFNDMANFGSLAQDKTEEEPEPEEDEDMVIM